MIIRLVTFIFILKITAFYSQNASFIINGDASDINVLNENGVSDCNCFQLTPNQSVKSGSVWNRNKIDLNQDITLEFKLYLGNNNAGADGVAFAFQPISDTVGGDGGGLGIEDVTPSFFVAIDTFLYPVKM